MTGLKAITKQNLGRFSFTGIEGGFGDGKRAMTVKDIAAIHGKEVKHINEAIIKNRTRFKNNVDIIDILGVDGIDPKDLGYSQQAINAYTGLKAIGKEAGIYLLSERGYSKLLKILEDDTAWEIYDQLVDNYFNMREKLSSSHSFSYMIEDPIARAQKWIEEQEEKKQALEVIERQKPKVLFADAVSTSKTSILIRELAKILKQNGVDIGQQRLFEWMRTNNYLIKRQGTDWNMPTQYSMERGWFEIIETSINRSDGSITIGKTPKVTGKGQLYFVNKFLNSQQLEKAH